jgi:hypothetical protein
MFHPISDSHSKQTPLTQKFATEMLCKQTKADMDFSGRLA